jgi:hypothetical protein
VGAETGRSCEGPKSRPGPEKGGGEDRTTKGGEESASQESAEGSRTDGDGNCRSVAAIDAGNFTWRGFRNPNRHEQIPAFRSTSTQSFRIYSDLSTSVSYRRLS